MINGNMDFWQRGTTFTGSTASVAYTSDRWQLNQGTGSISWTVDRSIDVPTVAQSGFNSTYSLRYTQGSTTSATGVLFNHKLEGYDYAHLHGGKKFRLQFWVKTSIAGTYGVVLENSAETRYYAVSYTVPNANTWTKITLDLVSDSSGTWNFDNNAGLLIWFGISQGTSEGVATSTLNTWTTGGVTRQISAAVSNFAGTNGATFQLAQVMLIPGDFTQAGTSTVDIPFQRAGRTIQQELAMCQRYCVNLNDTRNNFGYWGDGYAASTTVAYCTMKLPITMRTLPTLTTAGVAADFRLHDGVTATNCSALPILNPGGTCGADTASVQFTVASGLTQFRPYSFLAANNQNSKLIFEAEL
jgi:hypothetical protein